MFDPKETIMYESPMKSSVQSPRAAFSRRHFLENVAAAAASAPLAGAAAALAADKPAATPQPIERKIKLGVIGCGGRGQWVSKYFKQHGGYEFHAACDYFQDAVDQFGETFGVDKARRFCGLSGYKKLIASGVEAVAIEDLPYFYPEQAKAAVEAGRHVYLAKPVAVDVPGVLTVEAAGKLATHKKLCFLVDYQMPTDPVNIEIAKRIGEGALGKLAYVISAGCATLWPEPPASSTIEQRLRNSMWLRDVTLCGDSCVAFDIHSIDAMTWVLGQRPTSAVGYSRVTRPNPQLDGRDTLNVLFHCANGLIWNHVSQSLNNNCDLGLSAYLYGTVANARVRYDTKAYIQGGPKHYVGNVVNLYEAGVQRNVAQFYRNITEGRFENPTVKRAVDGHLTAILGREAAYRQGRLTMDELLKENKRLELDLSGLKS
jgi:predicted dehydrogenase